MLTLTEISKAKDEWRKQRVNSLNMFCEYIGQQVQARKVKGQKGI